MAKKGKHVSIKGPTILEYKNVQNSKTFYLIITCHS